MIRTKSDPPLVSQSHSLVLAWLKREAAKRMPGRHKGKPPLTQIAESAGVDEKTLRLAVSRKWDPRVSTLAKLEAVLPHGEREAKRARAA